MTTYIKRDQVSQSTIQYIRAQTLTLTLIESRPNTKVYVFFREINVTEFCYIDGNVMGSPLITDGLGQAVIKFKIPEGKFNVSGTSEIIVTDTTNLASLSVVGSTYGKAKSTFTSSGILQIWQPVEVTVVMREVIQYQVDPLAQSFFTFNVPGGIFITSIDVFFATKDLDATVRCEIRPLVNGYPSSVDASVDDTAILTPAEITTSDDASVSSKFVFNRPVYCKENGEFVFVLRSNSNQFNVYTAKMGERSIEDGRMIYEQPYVGSVFKSENAITWIAEQFEDIKFIINKAEFDITKESYIDLACVIPPLRTNGDQFETISGSNVITYTNIQDHGLEIGSKLRIDTRTDSLFANASFNGIPYTEFNAVHTVINVPDRYKVKFAVTTNATSTGIISSCNILSYIKIMNGGKNYSSDDTITFVGTGTGATASLTVVDGVITGVTITNSGVGYTSPPQLTINTVSGTKAVLLVFVEPVFNTYPNKPMHGITPHIKYGLYPDTRLSLDVNTTIGNYEGGNLTSYSNGRNVSLGIGEYILNIKQNSLVASSWNENDLMGGTYSNVLRYDLQSNNTNTSPFINLKDHKVATISYNRINNQNSEVITATSSSGSVQTLAITAAGSGYTIAPLLTIGPPDLPGGVQATGTTTLSASSIGTVAITNAGSGYTKTPLVVVSRAPGDVTGIGGAVQVALTDFNTELLPTGGNAKSKYITKKIQLSLISTGVKIYSLIGSNKFTGVDWYIRTSLSNSGVIHDELSWQLVPCNISVNKSIDTEMLEYEFTLENIKEFDSYDLKCVLRSVDPMYIPVIKNYRVIVFS